MCQNLFTWEIAQNVAEIILFVIFKKLDIFVLVRTVGSSL